VTTQTARRREAGVARGRRLVELLEYGARSESPRRRLLWVGIALLLVVGPVAFNLSREQSFRASIEIFPQDVPPYPAVVDARYYQQLLRDAHLRQRTTANVGMEAADYDRVEISHATSGQTLFVTATADDPAAAQRFVNELGPQIANATARQLSADAGQEADGIRSQLSSRRLPADARGALRQRLLALERLGPAPPPRAIPGTRAPLPTLERWADRVADALPGDLPARANLAWTALAGLLIATTLWALALLLVPPPGVAALVPGGSRELVLPRLFRTLEGRGRAWRERARPAVRAAPSTRMPAWALPVGLAVLAGSALFIMWAGRGETFLADEWAFILNRREWTSEAFLRPHNEHLSALPVAVYKTLFVSVGLSEYWVYRLAVVLGHMACVALVFTIARRRIGPLAAALLTAPILVFGPGWDVILYPFNLGSQVSVVAGLGMMLALDREDRRGDIAAGALLAAALASSSVGACFVPGAAAELLWRRDPWRRAAVVLAPAVLYGIWYLAYEPERQGPLDLGAAPAFAFHAATGALSALYGLPLGVETAASGYHRALELIAYAALPIALFVLARRVARMGRLTPRLVMVATTLGSFWLIGAVARGFAEEWYASRYVYTAAVLILILVAEAWSGEALPRRAAVLLVPVALGVAALNAGWLVKDGNGRRDDSQRLAAELAAVELARARVPLDFPIDDRRAKFVTARLYFLATEDLGSPALSPEELGGASPLARQAADEALSRALVRVRPYDRGSQRPPITSALAGSAARFARRRGGCIAVRQPRGRPVTATFTLPDRGVVVITTDPRSVNVGLRRFGSTFVTPASVRDRPGRASLIEIPPDLSTKAWRAQVSSTRPFRLC